MPVAAEIYYHINEHPEHRLHLPVVLIHGAGGNHLYWPSEVRRLAGCPVYALDLPGHGKSQGRGQQSIQAYVQNILAWLLEVGLPRAIFVGHSMGSAIALNLALEHREHVIALGLVGAAARIPPPAGSLEDSASQTTFNAAVQRLTADAFSPQAAPHLVELAANRMAETRASVVHGDLIACAAFDITRQLHRIRKPTLIITGADDKLTPVRQAQFLQSKLRNSRQEVIPGAGHMVMIEKPQEVASLLKGFLDELPH
jgi:pimeloyl-ACP methyl ester carboxylesterase